MENVDKTIDAICAWIQKKLKDDSNRGMGIAQNVPQMVSALAELVIASAHAPTLKR